MTDDTRTSTLAERIGWLLAIVACLAFWYIGWILLP